MWYPSLLLLVLVTTNVVRGSELRHVDAPVGIYSRHTYALFRDVKCKDAVTSTEVGLYDVVEHLKPTPNTRRTRESILTTAIAGICSSTATFATSDRRYTVDEAKYEGTLMCHQARVERFQYEQLVDRWKRNVKHIEEVWVSWCGKLNQQSTFDALDAVCRQSGAIASEFRADTPRFERMQHQNFPMQLSELLTKPRPHAGVGNCHRDIVSGLFYACDVADQFARPLAPR